MARKTNVRREFSDDMLFGRAGATGIRPGDKHRDAVKRDPPPREELDLHQSGTLSGFPKDRLRPWPQA
jgi:hypothetical protein